MAGKARIPPVLWVVFAVVDLAIVAAVLGAVFWVAPTPPAFGAAQTLVQARQAKPSGLVVAVVTADWCLSCQMYKRNALADQRFTDWVSANAGATALVWGRDDADIASLQVDRYPATVVLANDSILATHYGAMSIDDLLAMLDRAAASLGAPGAPDDAAPGAPASSGG